MTENVAQIIAQEASSQHKVLEINQEDLLNAIKTTSFDVVAQLEEYNKFRLDFERRSLSEGKVEKTEQVGLDDVIDRGGREEVDSRGDTDTAHAP